MIDAGGCWGWWVITRVGLGDPGCLVRGVVAGRGRSVSRGVGTSCAIVPFRAAGRLLALTSCASPALHPPTADAGQVSGLGAATPAALPPTAAAAAAAVAVPAPVHQPGTAPLMQPPPAPLPPPALPSPLLPGHLQNPTVPPMLRTCYPMDLFCPRPPLRPSRASVAYRSSLVTTPLTAASSRGGSVVWREGQHGLPQNRELPWAAAAKRAGGNSALKWPCSASCVVTHHCAPCNPGRRWRWRRPPRGLARASAPCAPPWRTTSCARRF